MFQMETSKQVVEEEEEEDLREVMVGDVEGVKLKVAVNHGGYKLAQEFQVYILIIIYFVFRFISSLI